MHRCALAGLLVAAIAIISVVAWKSAPQNNQVTAPAHGYRIIRTDAGFSPPTLRIRQGDSVTFVSQVEGHFWPASDLHPIHSLYSAFDPKRQLGKEEEWVFTFDMPGSFPYHDHLAPGLGGVIIVSAPEEKDSKQCEREEKTCWRARIKEMLEDKGLDAAFDEMSRLHETYEEFSWNCHDFAHDLGFLSYVKYDDRVPLTPKTAYCNGGFYHGYMEGFFSTHPATDAFEFCTKVRSTFSYEYLSAEKHCMHGIGHGTMEHMLQTNPGTWEENLPQLITEALAICEPIANPAYQDTCAGGVYNVASDWLGSGHLSRKYIPEENPFFLCQLTGEEWNLKRCTWEMGKRIMRFTEGDFAAALERAQEISILIGYDSYLPTMVRRIAATVGQKSVHETDARIVEPCRTLPPSLDDACIRGLADGLFQASTQHASMRMARFCLAASLTQKERVECTNLVMMTSLLSNERRERDVLCRMLSSIITRTEFCQNDLRYINISIPY